MRTVVVLGLLVLLLLAGCSSVPMEEREMFCAQQVWDAPIGTPYVEEVDGGFYCKLKVKDSEYYGWKGANCCR